MLALHDIIQQYPPYLQGYPKSILREYLQIKVLYYIFLSPWSKKLCFIGGTALRLIYNSQRFSEDLDFDNRGLTESEFEDMTHTIIQGLANEGYTAEIKHTYKGCFHCAIKIPNILYDNDLAPMANEKLMIKIDTTSQGYDYQPDITILQRFEHTSSIRVVPKNILLSMKRRAFFGRVKGRDLFDLMFLLGMHIEPDMGYMRNLCNIGSRSQLYDAIKLRLQQFDLDQLAQDVAPFLFDPQNTSVSMFGQYIKQLTWK